MSIDDGNVVLGPGEGKTVPVPGHKIGDVRGCGLFIGIEIIRDGNSKEPDAALTNSLSNRLKDNGFLVSHFGKFDNVLKLRPPLVFSHANADVFLGAFDECMGELGG